MRKSPPAPSRWKAAVALDPAVAVACDAGAAEFSGLNVKGKRVLKIPIARRIFYRNSPDSPEGSIQVTVEIFQPCLDSKAEPPVWKCLLVIEGLGRRIRQSCCGEDSIQALFHSLFIAGVMLSTSKFRPEIDLNDERNSFAHLENFGFPELKSVAFDPELFSPEA